MMMLLDEQTICIENVQYLSDSSLLNHDIINALYIQMKCLSTTFKLSVYTIY